MSVGRLENEADLSRFVRKEMERTLGNTRGKFANHASRLEAVETVSDWIEVGSGGAPAFENSWVNFGSGYATAAFSKDALDNVSLKGVVKSGSGVCFTLPTGYRPAGHEVFACQGNNGSDISARVEVSDAGEVDVVTSSSTLLSLCGITFRAA